MSLDSDDVVERLRTWTAFGTNVLFVRDLNAAIAEIGSLRAENHLLHLKLRGPVRDG